MLVINSSWYVQSKVKSIEYLSRTKTRCNCLWSRPNQASYIVTKSWSFDTARERHNWQATRQTGKPTDRPTDRPTCYRKLSATALKGGDAYVYVCLCACRREILSCTCPCQRQFASQGMTMGDVYSIADDVALCGALSLHAPSYRLCDTTKN